MIRGRARRARGRRGGRRPDPAHRPDPLGGVRRRARGAAGPFLLFIVIYIYIYTHLYLSLSICIYIYIYIHICICYLLSISFLF